MMAAAAMGTYHHHHYHPHPQGIAVEVPVVSTAAASTSSSLSTSISSDFYPYHTNFSIYDDGDDDQGTNFLPALLTPHLRSAQSEFIFDGPSSSFTNNCDSPLGMLRIADDPEYEDEADTTKWYEGEGEADEFSILGD